MNTINATEEFTDWVDALADVKARAAIYLRIRRAELGNFGEYKVLDEGVSEMKINMGPGYRVYFGQDGGARIVLLAGGTKKRQQDDINTVRTYWRDYKQSKRVLH